MAVEKRYPTARVAGLHKFLKKKKVMSIKDLIANGAENNVSVTIGVADLRNFFLELINEVEANKTEDKPESYLSQDEASKLLKVDRSTLWRWDKDNYLKKVRVGGKVRYRLSDIQKIMEA